MARKLKTKMEGGGGKKIFWKKICSKSHEMERNLRTNWGQPLQISLPQPRLPNFFPSPPNSPQKCHWFLYHISGAAYSRFAEFLNYDGSSNVLLFILTYGCWFKIILPISAKAPAQTQLRLSLALFFISPAAPPTREVYFSAAALLYMKMKYSRQCQLAVSVKAS